MIHVRRAGDRGHADHGWLRSWHTFSFADYHDPDHMGFRALRVINEDYVEPGQGFGTHGHRDMEIVTYLLDGVLQHRDSMGHGETMKPGEVQIMSAGTGVRHSEFNGSSDSVLHLLQIWILPDAPGRTPRYEQREFPAEARTGRLRLVVSPDGADGSLVIGQDARIHAAILDHGTRAEHRLADGRHAWIQVARGELAVNGQALVAGDGAAVSDERVLDLHATADSEFLLFDLA